MPISNVKDRFSQDSLAVELLVLIRPGIPPKERHVIEDALMEMGCEVIGGGGIIDGAESDIAICVDSVKKRLPEIMAILQQAKIGADSIITQCSPSEVNYSVYEESQTWIAKIPPEHSHKPWWKFWKK